MAHFFNMRRVHSIHFVGIGGAGMSGIAEVLLNQGYVISGSDVQENAVTRKLQSLGAVIYKGHDAQNVRNVDAVVISSAIAANNPEIRASRQARIPVLPRAQMLAELMRFHHGIAIAGTHGKTTTTSLVASVLAEGGFDPTFVIGGLLNSAGTHARLGESEYFIVEADESDASFLYFNPMISVVTNIDADHMQTYDNDFTKLRQAFIDFLHRLPFYGLAIVCIDNPVIRTMLSEISRPILTYGLERSADICAIDIVQKGLVTKFKVILKHSNEPLDITLNLPGQHNVLNALAAIGVALECKVSNAAICKALEQFKGVGRRLQVYGELQFAQGNVILIDDYGHHPQEISASLQAIRAAWPKRRIVLAFQPHRYSRTKALFEDFAAVLSEVDVLLLLEVYSASEAPIAGVDGRTLARSIRQRGKIEPIFVKNSDELFSILPTVLCEEDILITQGAGSISSVAPRLAANFLIGK
jgi:UDP-N-acetylmuramate--alanine ligase